MSTIRARTASAPQAGKPQTNAGDRDGRGRFLKGNGGGPGNPFSRQVAQLRSALIQAATPEDMKDIAQAMILEAKAGNVSAAKLLFQYLFGKPGEGIPPDMMGIESFDDGPAELEPSPNGEIQPSCHGPAEASPSPNGLRTGLDATSNAGHGKLRPSSHGPDGGGNMLRRLIEVCPAGNSAGRQQQVGSAAEIRVVAPSTNRVAEPPATNLPKVATIKPPAVQD